MPKTNFKQIHFSEPAEPVCTVEKRAFCGNFVVEIVRLDHCNASGKYSEFFLKYYLNVQESSMIHSYNKTIPDRILFYQEWGFKSLKEVEKRVFDLSQIADYPTYMVKRFLSACLLTSD